MSVRLCADLSFANPEQIWQTAYLGLAIWWAYHRDWPWTHTVFMVLHCLTLLMKQHSYASYNGHCRRHFPRTIPTALTERNDSVGAI